MTENSIQSQDMSLQSLLKDFYRVPNYQREYVWGEKDKRGNGGEEVEQYLSDIFGEFENATKDSAPEYFIGTIVVCKSSDSVFELIDGQQRTTTSYLTLCAIRDELTEIGAEITKDMEDQIASSSTDYTGETVSRYRLELQYEDAGDILKQYAEGKHASADKASTRSIQNIGSAYQTIRRFLKEQFKGDAKSVKRFYGYLTNKVKIIRIETPTVARALKIFETINDRGVGLDAMDLLKNLLFMNAKTNEFDKLKTVWKQLTDKIYKAKEKPLRFLRYYILASYGVDNKLREDDIYKWFLDNQDKTGHATDPLKFANELLSAAKAYSNFLGGLNVEGGVERGLVDTRILGGASTKQHLILLLAARNLAQSEFSELASEVEKTLFVWMMTDTQGKEYERKLVLYSRQLREVEGDEFDKFLDSTLRYERRKLRKNFRKNFKSVNSYDFRKYRLKYILSKLTQFIDIEAYGESEGRVNLNDYMSNSNDIEHIHPVGADETVAEEFGKGAKDWEVYERVGNLLLLEKSINRSIGAQGYAHKTKKFTQSKFLLTKCQGGTKQNEIGVADKITNTVRKIESFSEWNSKAINGRQKFLTKLACTVWEVRKLTEEDLI